MNIAICVFVALAALAWPFVILFNLIISPGSGDSLDTGLAGFAWVIVLFNLSVALFLAATRYGVPWWSWVVGIVVSFFYFASATHVPDLLKDGQPVRWMVAVPALGPLLILAFIAWISLPRLHVHFSDNLASLIVWGGMIVLTTIPWSRGQELDHKKAVLKADADRHAAEWVAQVQLHQDQFAQLPPDASVRDLLPFVDYQETSYHATERIRAIKNKEAQFEQIMASGDYSAFSGLYIFQLAPTPGLCHCVRQWLKNEATAGRPPVRTNSKGEVVLVNGYLYTLQWFAKQKCPMRDEINQYVAALRALPYDNPWTYEMLAGL